MAKKNKTSSSGKLLIYNPDKCSGLNPQIPISVNQISQAIKIMATNALDKKNGLNFLLNLSFGWNEKKNGINTANTSTHKYVKFILLGLISFLKILEGYPQHSKTFTLFFS